MRGVKENLGKVAITVEKDYWENTRAYDRLVIVELKGALRTFISRRPVPAGVNIFDRDYWLPFSSLQEEFVAQHNAWANQYSARVEALEKQLQAVMQQVQQQGANYAPLQLNVMSMQDRLYLAEYHNRVDSFIRSKTKVIVFTLQAVNCKIEFKKNIFGETYITFEDSDDSKDLPLFYSKLPGMFAITHSENKALFTTETVNKTDKVRHYTLVSFVEGDLDFEQACEKLQLETMLTIIADDGYYLSEDTLNYGQYFVTRISGEEKSLEVVDGNIEASYDIIDNSFMFVQAFNNEE